MLWRLLSAIILLFWAVMTGLVIRDTYFPDYSRFAIVPPRFVFDLFLTQAAATNNTLHFYHDREKLGHTTFAIRKKSETEDPPTYALLATGTVQLPGEGEKTTEVNFRMNGELLDAERWQNMDLEIKVAATKTEASIAWKVGDKLPEIEVKQGNQVIMNSAMLKTMMALKTPATGQFGWMSQIQAGAANSNTASPLVAREGIMDLAGKQRRCYIISLKVLKLEEVRAYFTEVGELARIELPQGYRLIEPMMHGLEANMNTMQ